MNIKIQAIDPEWSAWAKCPEANCKVVTHACCPEHVVEAMSGHVAGAH